jgi:P27 family predicted phage terminase small subunit
MRGRKPKPTTLHLVDGTDRKLSTADKRRRAREPRPEGQIGEAPVGFTPAQVEVWRRHITDSPEGLLTPVDAELLAGWCVLADARTRALELFNQAGGAVVVRSDHGIVCNPLLREFRRMTEQLRLLGIELGYSPAARARITLEVPDEGDELEEFLGEVRRPPPGKARP